MTRIRVNTDKSCDVLIERGLMSRAGDALAEAAGEGRRVAIITDDIVEGLYGGRVQRSLEARGFETLVHAMPAGEAHKGLAEWANMLQFLASGGITRSDIVLALGGGVPGDMAGFAAASYMRGVRLVQMPTTLLAMVDSSVGGKTGFNLAEGKNLVGAFHQPVAVLCDPCALDTLPPPVLADGTAEALKYGVLGDVELFAMLSTGAWLQSADTVIERCVRRKAALVAADEKDTGDRRLLNLGHTFGHAIEKVSGYTVTHGHAVAIGMVCAARLAASLGLCDNCVVDEIRAALEANSLPTESPFGASELAQAAVADKKRDGGMITLVLPRRVGECVLYDADMDELPRLMRLAAGR